MQSILLESSYNEKRYQECLQASQLLQDLISLSNQDRTEIGERGINLSGEQRARVALVGALFSSASNDVFLLDDPLSVLDPHAGALIFKQAIQSYLKDKTRIIVLNGQYHLLPLRDWVLVMSEGRLVGDGTFSEVIQRHPE